MQTRLALCALALALSASAACRDGQEPSVVAVVVVTPSRPTLTAVGATLQMTAEARDASGTVQSGAVFIWTRSDSTKVRVSASGLVTAMARGEATVTATTGGIRGGAVVTVAPVVRVVVVTPFSPTVIGVGSTLQLVAEARDSLGHAITDLPVSWASLDSSIARVSTAGLVTAVLAGRTTITATAGGVATSSPIQVRMSADLSTWLVVVSGSGQPATQHQVLTDPLVARAIDQDGVAIPGIPVTFAVPAGGGAMTCHTCRGCGGVASIQVTTRNDGTAILGDPGGYETGCTPHSGGRVLRQASSPGFHPATFSFVAAPAGERFDGLYMMLPGGGSWFEVRNGAITGNWCSSYYSCAGGTVASSDGAVYSYVRQGPDYSEVRSGFVTIDSLGQATASGTWNFYYDGRPFSSGTWNAQRH